MWSNFGIYFDYSILRWLTSLIGRSATFDNVLELLAHGEQAEGMLIMSIFWGYWFRQTDQATTRRTREHLLCTMAAAVVGLFLARVLARTLPFRLRPRFQPALGSNWPVAPDSLVFVDWSSFPSDHAVMFFALATGLCFVSWRMGLIALLFVLAAICFPRVYFGVHYPTDILFGAALGVIVAYCLNGIQMRRRLAGRALAWEQSSPQGFYVAMFLTTFQFATMFNSARHFVQTALHLVHRLFTGGGSIL